MRFFAAICLAAALTACRETPQTAGGAAPAGGGPRIVSLSPAISRTLKDFHVEDRIVGRTPWCESIDPAIAVVGDLYNLDYESLIKIDPTHILVQPPSTGIDAMLVDLAARRHWTIGQWGLDSIDDVETLIRELPAVLANGDLERLEELSSRSAVLLNDLAQALSPRGGDIYRGRTLLVLDFEPVMAFGPGSFLHDVLVALGGRNALDSGSYRSLSLEDVLRLDPDAIIVVKPYAGRNAEPAAHLGALAETRLTAVAAGRVAVLSHPDAAMPSTGLIGVADEMRRILVSFAAGAP